MAAGLTPSNNDLTQLTQAIELLGRIPYVIDQGVANMIVVNPDPIITVYANEIVLAIKVAVGNTGAVTINVSGLGPIPLHRPSGAALIATDLRRRRNSFGVMPSTFPARPTASLRRSTTSARAGRLACLLQSRSAIRTAVRRPSR